MEPSETKQTVEQELEEIIGDEPIYYLSELASFVDDMLRAALKCPWTPVRAKDMDDNEAFAKQTVNKFVSQYGHFFIDTSERMSAENILNLICIMAHGNVYVIATYIFTRALSEAQRETIESCFFREIREFEPALPLTYEIFTENETLSYRWKFPVTERLYFMLMR